MLNHTPRRNMQLNVKKTDDFEVIESRYGKKVADEKSRAMGQLPRSTKPLEGLSTITRSPISF